MGIYTKINSRKQEPKEKIADKIPSIQEKVEPLIFLLTRKCTSS